MTCLDPSDPHPRQALCPLLGSLSRAGLCRAVWPWAKRFRSLGLSLPLCSGRSGWGVLLARSSRKTVRFLDHGAGRPGPGPAGAVSPGVGAGRGAGGVGALPAAGHPWESPS